MTISVSTLQKNRILNIITGFTQTNYGLASAANSKIVVYSGAAPGIENAASGTLLATFPMWSATTSQSMLYGASGGIAQLVSSIPVTAAATATAGYARWIDSNNAAVFEGTVGVTSSGADFILDSLAITISTTTTLVAAAAKLPGTLGTVQMNSTLVDAVVDQVARNTAVIPGLGASGTIFVYTGSAPASVESVATGTLLAQFSTGTQGWAAAAAGVANLVSSLTIAPVDTGTAGYARWVKGGYTLQCSIGTTATDIIVSTTSFVSGTPVSITDMSLSF
ncbi:MAG: hypothetical protein WC859_10110 [Elusimicrobiota bacterium]|jgi:hypothetical protein